MSEKNERPEETSKFPYIAVVVLVILIAGLLYGGYEYIADDAAQVDELMNTPLDTTGKDLQPSLQAIDKSQTAASDTLNADLTEPINNEQATTTTTSDPKNNEDVATDEPKTEKPTAELPKNLGGEESSHTVQAGETFFGIANRYNLKWSTLKALNPEITDEAKDVKSGVTKLKIRVQAVHTVGAGDILRVVAKKYGVTVEQLMAANKKTKNHTERGEQLIIPLATKK